MQIKRKVQGLEQVVFDTPINEGCKRHWSLQGEDYITLKFNLASPITFRIGDYCDTTINEGGSEGRFYITSPAFPSYNSSNGGYEYELQFDAEYKLWNNYVFKYTTATSEVEWKLTDFLNHHLDQLLRNLKALGLSSCWDGNEYSYDIDWEKYDEQGRVLSGVVSTEAKLVEYSNTKIVDALDAMAEAWECEWWIEGHVIHFGYCEKENAPEEIQLGVNAESWNIDNSSGTHATRIYAFGSTRNIPSTYRRSVLVSTANSQRYAHGKIYTDNLVCLSQSQLNVSTEEESVKAQSGKVSLTGSVKPSGENYTRYTYEQIVEAVTGSVVYRKAKMPHEIEFESSEVSVKVYGDKSPTTPWGENYSADVSLTMIVSGEDGAELYRYSWDKKTATAAFAMNATLTFSLPRYIPSFGEDTKLTFKVKITPTFGTANVVQLLTPNATRHILVAKPIKVAYIDSSFKTLGEVTIYIPYIGLPYPSLKAEQDEKDRYNRNNEYKGRYYYPFLLTDIIGENRLYFSTEKCKGEIPFAWYSSNYNDSTLYAIGDRRLMLPVDTLFVESDGLSDNEAVEDVAVFDDIYPRMKDMTIGEIHSKTEEGVVTEYEDGTKKTEKYSAFYMRDSRWIKEGEPWMLEDYILSGQTLRIRFSSGMLNGMEFDLLLDQILVNEQGENLGKFDKIIRNEDYGVKLPNETLRPQAGDKIIYIGWDESKMGSTGLVEAAEYELLAKAKEYLAKSRIDDRTYEAVLMETGKYTTAYLKESELRQLQDKELKNLAVMQSNTPSKNWCMSMMAKGKKVKVIDDSAEVYDPESKKMVNYRISRVIGYEHPLDIPYDHPSITIGVSGMYSRLADIENKLRKQTHG